VKSALASAAAANTGSAQHCQLALVSKLLPEKQRQIPGNQRQLPHTQLR